jgi:hypothetical protein
LSYQDIAQARRFAFIGDIRDCYDELSELLDAMHWSPQSHILILTGDPIDRGPKIKETLIFAMNTLYSLISNYERKLLRYLRWHYLQTTVLVKTIEQCGEAFLRDASFLRWLRSVVVRISLSVPIVETSFSSFPTGLFRIPKPDKTHVFHWGCALDGGVVFGGTLPAYVENKGTLEIDAKRTYEPDEEKGPLHRLQL